MSTVHTLFFQPKLQMLIHRYALALPLSLCAFLCVCVCVCVPFCDACPRPIKSLAERDDPEDRQANRGGRAADQTAGCRGAHG